MSRFLALQVGLAAFPGSLRAHISIPTLLLPYILSCKLGRQLDVSLIERVIGPLLEVSGGEGSRNH